MGACVDVYRHSKSGNYFVKMESNSSVRASGVKKEYVFYFLFSLICFSNFDVLFDGARYVKYTLMPFAAFFWAAQKFKLGMPPASIVGAFLILILWMLLHLAVGNGSSVLGGKDVVFIASYAVPLALFFTPKISAKVIFFIYSVSFLVVLPFQDHSAISIVNSTAYAESISSFIFGAFTIAFLMRRELLPAVFSLILLFLTLKRIALLGVLVCIIIYVMPRIIRNIAIKPISILGINLLICILLGLLTVGQLDGVIGLITSKGASELTLGRVGLYSGVINDMISNPGAILFGHGPGSAYAKALVDFTGGSEKHNLHSDTLKILYENGILIFCLFFYYAASMVSVNSRIILVYLSILFATDNVLIYSDVMLVVLILLCQFEAQERNRVSSVDNSLKQSR